MIRAFLAQIRSKPCRFDVVYADTGFRINVSAVGDDGCSTMACNDCY